MSTDLTWIGEKVGCRLSEWLTEEPYVWEIHFYGSVRGRGQLMSCPF